MKLRLAALAIVLSVGSAGGALAAVTASSFPPKTVRDLLSLCMAPKSDPMMMAEAGFCHGYVEGAVVVEMAHERQKNAHVMFCIPSPPPNHSQVMASFAAWADAQPARLDQPAIDGLFTYLAQAYPCARHM
ncbi:MAG TPA: Rap1a/Tai family immunity protein [Acetobacteraceae bacterium]|nr:Rap1a/Tai family immunity protein [Acetobacteraceae bacterium]